jgi:cell division protein FtsQ
MNPWHNVRMLNIAANALFAAALIGLMAAAALWVAHRPMFALKHVEIEALDGHSLAHAPEALLGHAARRAARGGFFTVNLSEVRTTFESVPWVRRASVRRIWPDRLRVALEEHQPVALWGDERLLNASGEVFTANVVEAEEQGPLPSLNGPEGSSVQVLRRFDELKGWLAGTGLNPASLALSDRHAWTLHLDDGTVLLLGRDQGVPIEDRVRRWAAVYPRVQTRLERGADVVDLRYPNGFAVRANGLVGAREAPAGRRAGLAVAGRNYSLRKTDGKRPQ